MSIEIDNSAAPFLRRNPWLMNRVMLFDGLATHSAAVLRGLQDATDSARDDYKDQDARARRLEAEQAARNPMAQPPDVILAERESADRLKSTWDGLAQEVKDAGPVTHSDKAVKAGMIGYLSRLLATGEDIKAVPTALPNGDLVAPLAKYQDGISSNSKLQRTIRNAPITEEEALRRAIANLDERVAGAMPRVNFDPQRGPQLYWNFESLDDTDIARGVPNLEPMVLKLAYPDIVEHLKTKVAEHYSTIEIALDARTKRERLKTLSAELLALERVEVEIIIALRKQGVLTAFRPKTDPRALLGVAGPDPRGRDNPDFMEVGDFADA